METAHPRIMKSNEDFLIFTTFQEKIHELEILLEKGRHKELSNFLRQIVSGYEPHKSIVDWIYLEEGVNELH
jgi:FlaA1/EpsC-like NDP-sugar epimerase